MKRTMGWMMVAAALLATPSMAQAGFTMGARLGFAFPGGEIEQDANLNDYVSMSVPIMFQAGAAFAQNRFSVEGFLELSPMSLDADLQDGCDALGYSCGALGMRFGALASFRFMPQASMTPWVGAGLGWELLLIDLDTVSGTYTGTSLELMGGLDFQVGRVFAFGPFLSLQFGTYTNVDVDNGTTYSYDPEAGMHTWLELGIRGRFDFGGGGRGAPAYAPVE